MNDTEEIDTIRRALEYAPEKGPVARDLVGLIMPGGSFVCAQCVGRIYGRGAGGVLAAGEQVWSGTAQAHGECIGCAADREKMDKQYCAGCYNDDYNRGLGGATECWYRKNAVVILRRRVHMDDVPPWRAEPETLPNCYQQQRYIFVKPDQEH